MGKTPLNPPYRLVNDENLAGKSAFPTRLQVFVSLLPKEIVLRSFFDRGGSRVGEFQLFIDQLLVSCHNWVPGNDIIHPNGDVAVHDVQTQ